MVLGFKFPFDFESINYSVSRLLEFFEKSPEIEIYCKTNHFLKSQRHSFDKLDVLLNPKKEIPEKKNHN